MWYGRNKIWLKRRVSVAASGLRESWRLVWKLKVPDGTHLSFQLCDALEDPLMLCSLKTVRYNEGGGLGRNSYPHQCFQPLESLYVGAMSLFWKLVAQKSKFSDQTHEQICQVVTSLYFEKNALWFPWLFDLPHSKPDKQWKYAYDFTPTPNKKVLLKCEVNLFSCNTFVDNIRKKRFWQNKSVTF